MPTVYITNLNAGQYPDEVIRNAYRMHWNSETEIGTAKNELQIEIFSGTSEICIRQDFFAALILYNIESIIRLFCNKKLQSHTGRIQGPGQYEQHLVFHLSADYGDVPLGQNPRQRVNI